MHVEVILSNTILTLQMIEVRVLGGHLKVFMSLPWVGGILVSTMLSVRDALVCSLPPPSFIITLASLSCYEAGYNVSPMYMCSP